MINSGDYVTTIAECEGQPVGFTMAQISDGYIFACFVRFGFEGQGIGRAIMTAAEAGLAGSGVKESWLAKGIVVYMGKSYSEKKYGKRGYDLEDAQGEMNFFGWIHFTEFFDIFPISPGVCL